MNISNINENIIAKPDEEIIIKKVYINHFQTDNKPFLAEQSAKPYSRIKRDQSPLKPLNIVQSVSRNDKLKLAPIGTINGQTIINNPDSILSNESSRNVNKYLLSKIDTNGTMQRSSFPSLTNDSNRNQNENSVNFLKLLNGSHSKLKNPNPKFKLNSQLSLAKLGSNKPQFVSNNSKLNGRNKSPIEPFLVRGNSFIFNNLAVQVMNTEQKNLFESKVSQHKINLKSTKTSNLNDKMVGLKNDKINKPDEFVVIKKIRNFNHLLEPNLTKCQGLYTKAVTSSSQLKMHQFNSRFMSTNLNDRRLYMNKSNLIFNHTESDFNRRNVEFIENEQQVLSLKRQIDSYEAERKRNFRNKDLNELDKQVDGDLGKKLSETSTRDGFKFYESEKITELLMKLKPMDVNGSSLKRTLNDSDDSDELAFYNNDDDDDICFEDYNY